MDQENRFSGSLFGLAVGDALGTTLEFKSPGTFRPIDDMVGGGPFGLKPGQWTDDTSMALCLAESLVECQGFDADDQMRRYRRWYREGYLSSTGRCFDIGNTVRAAIERFETTGDPIAGSTDAYSAGNGSIMRLAPIPLYYADKPMEAIQYAAESSRTTHGAIEAVDACRFLTALILGALKGYGKDELLAADFWERAEWGEQSPLTPKIAAIAKGSYKDNEPPTIKGSGYVVASLEAGLWAFNKADTYKEGALLAVNLGDDADTTGAVYGQLAGAFYGLDGIPKSWVETIAYRPLIEELAGRLYVESRKSINLSAQAASVK